MSNSFIQQVFIEHLPWARCYAGNLRKSAEYKADRGSALKWLIFQWERLDNN